jgi:Co/Zn/Cd efflux system component
MSSCLVQYNSNSKSKIYQNNKKSCSYISEVVGAFASILIIWCMTAVILYFAIQRIIKQDFHINADDMLITAGCGVAFNIM